MSKLDDAYADYLVWLDACGLLEHACDPLHYEKVNGGISSNPNNVDAILRNNNRDKDK